MSKKFFSLIYGDSIHVAPKTKVISADAFSKLIDAEGILEKLREDAEKYKKEVVTECEKLKEQAQREGFEEGFKKWVEQIAKMEDEISKVRTENEKILVPVALKAAKKIVGREMEMSPETVVDIVTNILKTVSQHKKVTIYVNKVDLDYLETSRNRIKQVFENLEALSIIPRDDVKPGGCIIETERGIINAQLENQWRILEKAFESMMIKTKK